VAFGIHATATNIRSVLVSFLPPTATYAIIIRVIRPKAIKVEYLDYHGKKQILDADGLLSICVQHEIDHLNGIVFVDHISKLRKDMILKKLTKQQKAK